MSKFLLGKDFEAVPMVIVFSEQLILAQPCSFAILVLADFQPHVPLKHGDSQYSQQKGHP